MIPPPHFNVATQSSIVPGVRRKTLHILPHPKQWIQTGINEKGWTWNFKYELIGHTVNCPFLEKDYLGNQVILKKIIHIITRKALQGLLEGCRDRLRSELVLRPGYFQSHLVRSLNRLVVQ